jgi:hypothetical protein
MSDEEKPSTGYETTDVPVRPLRLVVVVFVVIVASCLTGTWWMFRYLRKVDSSRDVRRTSLQLPSPIPPEPRLEIDPTQDWVSYRRQQEQLLNSYGWVSREQGRVRIPITKAMELVAERENKK